jgi:PPOX class probable F420-dependent enzyme
MQIAAGLKRIDELGRQDHWLAVLVTQRADGEPAPSLVNAGVLPHPLTGVPVVALVSRGGTAKLANLRRRPQATLVFRAGWEWISVAGTVQLAGPDDPLPGLSPAAVPGLLRDIYAAAGGNHPDPAEYDRVMVTERRAAVLVRPDRFAANPTGADHREPE